MATIVFLLLPSYLAPKELFFATTQAVKYLLLLLLSHSPFLFQFHSLIYIFKLRSLVLSLPLLIEKFNCILYCILGICIQGANCEYT